MKNIYRIACLFVFTACSGNESAPEVKEVNKEAEIRAQIEAEEELERKAKNLLNNTCFTCHNKDLAPPMEEVKAVYINDSTSREEFVEAVVNWVFNPSEVRVRLPEAQKKWGLMPKQEFNEEDVRIVVGYIYDTDLSGIVIPK